jgi:hypothetical protein
MSKPVFMRMSDGALMELGLVANDTREPLPLSALGDSSGARIRLRFRPVGSKAGEFERMDFLMMIPAEGLDA